MGGGKVGGSEQWEEGRWEEVSNGRREGRRK